MHVDTAITSRKSVRRFLNTPVDRATNIWPWNGTGLENVEANNLFL
ncbi:hypothetical protein [Vreelandella populi]|nr:hypothetical protein [Halomonas populi]